MGRSLFEQLKPISADAQEERLLSFLRSCGGPENTPAYNVMANQLGILGEGVRVLLGRLETKGRIHFISRNPPRIMLTVPGQPIIETGVAPQSEGAQARFLDAEGERMRLGRFIADCERKALPPPSLRALMDFVGFGSAGYVARMAEILAERGIIQYGRGLPTRLTEQGRAFFHVRTIAPVETKVEEGAKIMEKIMGNMDRAGRVIIQRGRKVPGERVAALCRVLASAIRANPASGNYTHYEVIGPQLGYSKNSSSAVSDIVKAAVDAGYIRPKPSKTRGLFFTDLGIKRFMPEALEEALEVPAPQPEISFTGRVPKDSPLREAALEAFPMETPAVAQVAQVVTRSIPAPGGLDFDLNSKRLCVTGSTKSKSELAAFIGKLGSLMLFLGE